MKRKLLGYYDYTVILTYCGMMFSFFGLLRVINQDYWNATLSLMFAGVCDMFDGAVASTKERNESEKRFGIQIDSFSDLISFGVLPAVFVYMISNKNAFVGVVSSLFVLCALILLAYFNVLEEERQRQTDEGRKSYLGVPVLLVIMGIAYLLPVQVKKPGKMGKVGIIFLGLLEMLGMLLFMGWDILWE